MCGIAGIVLKNNISLPDMQQRLSDMAHTMQHRGPDDEGVWMSPDERVGLASRRLAIQDLSPAGHMPMGNAAGTVWLAYNGEIYNAGQLRPELERRSYNFRSHNDTEVLLYGYEAWGEDVVHRLRGMWTFAIYASRETASFSCRATGSASSPFIMRTRRKLSFSHPNSRHYKRLVSPVAKSAP